MKLLFFNEVYGLISGNRLKRVLQLFILGALTWFGVDGDEREASGPVASLVSRRATVGDTRSVTRFIRDPRLHRSGRRPPVTPLRRSYNPQNTTTNEGKQWSKILTLVCVCFCTFMPYHLSLKPSYLHCFKMFHQTYSIYFQRFFFFLLWHNSRNYYYCKPRTKNIYGICKRDWIL